MSTETASPRFSAIERWDAADILDALVEGQLAAAAAVRAARRSLEDAALGIEERLREGGRLAYAGAGTSGRIAAQDGAELTPTFGWPAERVVILVAGGPQALLEAVEGAEDSLEHAREMVRAQAIGERDALIAVAASGATPFTLACVEEARARGAFTIGIANNPDAPLLTAADRGVFLDTGPEAIAGSTRMKAGTAQKIALNLISSLVMIRLGRVFSGLMVDVQATNRKLMHRSENILMQLTDRGREEVRAALDRAGGSVKLAVLLLQGAELDEARAALERSAGHLRAALGQLGR